MLTLDDKSVLDDFEKAEAEEPSPAKIIDSTRTIYGSRKLGPPKDSQWGQPVLCDFGEVRIGNSHRGLIQPELYRSPEVLFGMEWDTSVDVWNVAVLVSADVFADTSSLLIRLCARFGTCSKTGIYSTRWTKTLSHQQHTMSPRWLHILECRPLSTFKEAKHRRRSSTIKVSKETFVSNGGQ